MRKSIHLLKRLLISLVVLIALAMATVYTWSSLLLNKKYDVPFTNLNVPIDAASIQEGERLIRIAHCRDCHGEHLTGRVFRILKDTTEMVGSNLTSVIGTYSNEELERAIRHGIKKSGTSIFFMPSEMYYELKDESVARIIAYLRTIKPHASSPDLPTSIIYFPLGRLQLIRGKFQPKAAIIKHTAPRQYAGHDTTQVAFGRYLTMTTCSNCHGKDLKGSGQRPNLVIAAAYTKEQFYHLIRTGEGGLGRSELGQMSELARDHFSYLNDFEIGAIYSFLKTLPYRKD